MGARAFIPMALAGAFILALAPSSPAAAAEPKTEAQQIVKIAKQQIGDPYRYGAKGPRSFDCSGLVIYSYTKAGDAKVIGKGKYRSARAMYKYFKSKGLASRSNPKLGDLVIWGGGTHVGIYVGNGKAVSALTGGVRIHKVHAVTARFTAYLHTGMSKKSANGSSAAPTSSKASSDKTIRHIRGSVNFRKGAGTDKAKIRVLRHGTRLEVLGKAKDGRGRTWLHVKVGSRSGWVASWLTR
ncbi:MAG TPA: NlpC/P60 family protein [Candidatus Saccharimonadales bacterium]|nr:NlpC/P60 family protein [Candidatus Saccharimonadales bacterium]